RAAGPGAVSLSLIPAPAVVAVDTTGAGDAHAGVFLAGLAAGLRRGGGRRPPRAAPTRPPRWPSPARGRRSPRPGPNSPRSFPGLRLDDEPHGDHQVPRADDDPRAERDIAPHGHGDRDPGAGGRQRPGWR